jgi:hypothetical protein
MSDAPKDDEVGYGQTPKRTRFRKGESRNRNRRYPKRREGRLKIMMRLLLQPVENYPVRRNKTGPRAGGDAFATGVF